MRCAFFFEQITTRRVLRFLTVIALAIWFGGFTFYSTAVIATSQKVLHSQLRAGLITQQVTNWLNWISLPTLAICCWNWLAYRVQARRGWTFIMGVALAAMALAQIALFPAHWTLDAQIIGREVGDEGQFFRLHRVYLVISTLQWCAALVYIWSALALWERSQAQAAIVNLPVRSEQDIERASQSRSLASAGD